jgi:hypothetical protein
MVEVMVGNIYYFRKHWLQTQGSPSSRIDKTVFGNERNIEKLEFDKFRINHD